MRNHYLKHVVARWTGENSRVVAHREGLTETIFYVRRDLLGHPLNWHLATNGFSMSDTSLLGQRYMRLFVHWPMALRPDARKALLISFGVGSTAKALTDTPWLERIDVVDTSRDILEMGRTIFPRGGYPLDDPRVRVHVEDGRFFLLAGDAAATDPVCSLSPHRPLIDAVVAEVEVEKTWTYRAAPASRALSAG